MRTLKEKGDPRLLEPIMKVEVTSPEDYVGSVIMRGNATIINAMVPLANMFGYVNTLRSFSQGRAGPPASPPASVSQTHRRPRVSEHRLPARAPALQVTAPPFSCTPP